MRREAKPPFEHLTFEEFAMIVNIVQNICSVVNTLRYIDIIITKEFR